LKNLMPQGASKASVSKDGPPVEGFFSSLLALRDYRPGQRLFGCSLMLRLLVEVVAVAFDGDLQTAGCLHNKFEPVLQRLTRVSSKFAASEGQPAD
jgi:hypothetical protein